MVLRILLIGIVYCLFPFSVSHAAEDTPPPVPVPSVQVEALFLPQQPTPITPGEKPGRSMQTDSFSKTLSGLKDGVIVLELFSTQACIFCPKADALMQQFVDQPNIIALSCHVDYFDVQAGSLALPFCSSRQGEYESSLDIGSKYTPQIVVNGRYDAIGYRVAEVNLAIERAVSAPIKRADISMDDRGFYTMTLPDVDASLSSEAAYQIWLMVYNMPHNLEIADGGNRGKEITYYNVVSKVGFLGKWDGQSKDIIFDAKLADSSKGFAVVVQNSNTKQIILAGKYLK